MSCALTQGAYARLLGFVGGTRCILHRLAHSRVVPWNECLRLITVVVVRTLFIDKSILDHSRVFVRLCLMTLTQATRALLTRALTSESAFEPYASITPRWFIVLRRAFRRCG
tara:strand:- start:544 stop:879 length:336 start_codon:yes stop_codon:yes gene_type:complete